MTNENISRHQRSSSAEISMQGCGTAPADRFIHPRSGGGRKSGCSGLNHVTKKDTDVTLSRDGVIKVHVNGEQV